MRTLRKSLASWKVMGRREFAALLPFIPLAAVDSQHHIGNRRLFNFTAGAIKLEGWEREHLHRCEGCQKTVYAVVQSGT